MRKIIFTLIKLYQYLISPCLRPCCRFYPSCSEYALLAIDHYGMGKGTGLALYRLLRCHPFAKGGYDPLLPTKEKL